MNVEVEIPYPVRGVLPHHRNETEGVAVFRKNYDLREVTDDTALAPAFSFNSLGSSLSPARNLEGHDIRSTALLDGVPWMSIGFGPPDYPGLSLSDRLSQAISRRIERTLKLTQDGFDTIDPAKFRSITRYAKEQSEALANETVSRMMFWRGRLWERDVVPMYAVHGGARPDVSVVPSSSARYNFFDHFLPDDRDAALDRFLELGGNESLPSIIPAANFKYGLGIHRTIIGRTAKELVDCLGDGVHHSSIGRWRLRLGGMKLLRAAELIDARFDDDTLELAELGQALTAVLAVASELRPAPDDPLSKATEMGRHRLSGLLAALAKAAAREPEPPAPKLI